MIRRGWSVRETGELTIAAAQILLAEEPYHDAAWQLMDFAARAMGGKGVIPARPAEAASAMQVIPELQRQLERLGWRGPGGR